MTTFSAGNSRSRSSRTYENTEVVFCLKTNATNNIVCTKTSFCLCVKHFFNRSHDVVNAILQTLSYLPFVSNLVKKINGFILFDFSDKFCFGSCF